MGDPVTTGAAIQGGAALGGGLLNLFGGNRASDQQYRSQQEALNFAREQEEQRRREWQAEQQRQDAMMRSQWQTRLPALQAAYQMLQRRGYDIQTPNLSMLNWGVYPQEGGTQYGAPTGQGIPAPQSTSQQAPYGLGSGPMSQVGGANEGFRQFWGGPGGY